MGMSGMIQGMRQTQQDLVGILVQKLAQGAARRLQSRAEQDWWLECKPRVVRLLMDVVQVEAHKGMLQ